MIADGSRAYICWMKGTPDKALGFVPGADFRHATPPNWEIYSERHGSTLELAGVSRSAEDRNDAHAQQKERFVQTLITFLREKLFRKDFDHWVLVAPPEILSDFRKHLDPTLKDVPAGELAKDLTKVPACKILGHLHGVLSI